MIVSLGYLITSGLYLEESFPNFLILIVLGFSFVTSPIQRVLWSGKATQSLTEINLPSLSVCSGVLVIG